MRRKLDDWFVVVAMIVMVLIGLSVAAMAAVAVCECIKGGAA